MHVAQSQVSAR